MSEEEKVDEPAAAASPEDDAAAPAAEAPAVDEAAPEEAPPADEAAAELAPAEPPRAAPAAPPPEESDEAMQEREKMERDKAILKIQSLQRGRQTRQVLSKNDLEGARAIFAERHMMHDQNMDANVLSREQGEGMEAQKTKQQDDATAQAAHKIALEHQKEEEVAAVRMQSLYRGFRDRRQVRDTRESAEKVQRERIAEETRKAANEHQHVMDMQTSFTAGGMEKSYITATRKDGPARRSPGKSKTAAKAILTPTLVDKKAIMTAIQKRACIVLEEMIKKWATSYARSVELAPGAEKTGELEFVAFFSKPSKEEPIAWPVVRVYLSMTRDFEKQLVPQVTYQPWGRS